MPSWARQLHYSTAPTAGRAWRTCKEIAVCDLKTGNSRTLPIAKAGWPGELFAFAPDGKTLTALVGRTLHRWDLSTGKDFYADVSGRGHNGPVVAVAWSPNSKHIATMSQDFQASVCVWDAGTGKLLRTLPASEERWFAWCYRLALRRTAGGFSLPGATTSSTAGTSPRGKRCGTAPGARCGEQTADAPGSVPPHRQREAGAHPHPG